MTGAPVASPSKTTGGIALDSRKPASTIPACATAIPRSSRRDLAADATICIGTSVERCRRSARRRPISSPAMPGREVHGRERVGRRPRVAVQRLVRAEEDRRDVLSRRATGGSGTRRPSRRRRDPGGGAPRRSTARSTVAAVERGLNLRLTTTSSSSSERTASKTSGLSPRATPACLRHVEVPGITDDDEVEIVAPWAQQPASPPRIRSPLRARRFRARRRCVRPPRRRRRASPRSH